jgi:hypothetical protein
MTYARWTSARAAAAFTADPQDAHVQEHAAFLDFCKQHRVSNRGVAPIHVCSATRSIGIADQCRAAILDGTAEERSAATARFDFRGGRGMLATRDFEPGSALLRAPVAALAINVETLQRRHGGSLETRYSKDDATAAAFKGMPTSHAVHDIVKDMMIRDTFYHHQLYLTMWVAWERFDADSPLTPYFNTLPVPAVDNDVVLVVHAGGLSSAQSSEYMEYHQDFLFALKRIRSAWVDRVTRLAVSQDLKDRALLRVPPIQVMDWAWRTVLGRQLPLPPSHLAPAQSCFRGSTNRSVNYTQWFELQQQQHLLMPSLVPFFDLLDHQPVPNVEIDVIMRPLRPDLTVDDEAADEYTRALSRHEKLSTKAIKTPKVDPLAHRRGGMKDILRTVNYLKQAADKAQAYLVGATGGTYVNGDPGSDAPDGKDTRKLQAERAQLQTETERRLREVETATETTLTPVIEMRATQHITEGDALGVHFALLHSRSFTLYRFGFEPV